MAVPTVVTDLSQTASSNSPSGSDTISGTLDDYIRAGASIQAQEAQNKGWLPQTSTPTYISVSTFSVTTDQTATYYPGRPIRATITGNLCYGVVVASVFGAVTTVTVIVDRDLDITLSRIDLGMESRPIHAIQNRLINPWFRFWQRNTTFALGAGTNANVADGFAIQAGAAGVVACTQRTHTVGQTVVPFEPRFFLEWDQTTGGTTPNLKQHIEDVRTFAGQLVTVWFIGKVASGTLAIVPRVVQNFGAGGAPSADVITSGTSKTVGTTFKLYWTTIVVPSISGKTVGTTAGTHSLRVDLKAPDATTFTFSIAAMGINLGATPFIHPPLPEHEELIRVRRRFFKTFGPDVTPSQNSTTYANAPAYTACRAGANAHWLTYPLTTPLRTSIANTAVTFYSPFAATTAWWNYTGGAASGASSVIGTGGTEFTSFQDCILLKNAQAAGDAVGDLISVHFAVDAEFSAA